MLYKLNHSIFFIFVFFPADDCKSVSSFAFFGLQSTDDGLRAFVLSCIVIKNKKINMFQQLPNIN